MIQFANPLHNTIVVRIDGTATGLFRTFAGETWCQALARQSFPGCTAEWIRERWMKLEVIK